jgi:hypothetical protein
LFLVGIDTTEEEVEEVVDDEVDEGTNCFCCCWKARSSSFSSPLPLLSLPLSKISLVEASFLFLLDEDPGTPPPPPTASWMRTLLLV